MRDLAGLSVCFIADAVAQLGAVQQLYYITEVLGGTGRQRTPALLGSWAILGREAA